MNREDVTPMEMTPHLEAWRVYLLHVVPDQGGNCAPCLKGAVPQQGCAEGVRLYQEFAARRLGDDPQATADDSANDQHDTR